MDRMVLPQLEWCGRAWHLSVIVSHSPAVLGKHPHNLCIKTKGDAMGKKLGASIGLALGVAWALGGCAMPEQEGVLSAEKLQGPEWVAVSIDGVAAVRSPAPKLRWTGAEQVAGSGGCNAFVGSAVLQGSELRLGPLAATRRACMPTPSGQEDMFFKALENTRTARLEDEQLVLVDQTGKVLVRLAKAK
jgi:heat shock protein HslJ